MIDAYPAVRHQVPSFIFENNLLGPFVRARDVPAVLAYVEKVLDALVPGERRLYETLAKVLRAAAARGLAFWEATSIEVPQAHEEWLEAGPTASGALVTVPSPAQFGGGSVLAQAGDWYILSRPFRNALRRPVVLPAGADPRAPRIPDDGRGLHALGNRAAELCDGSHAQALRIRALRG